MHGRYLKEKSRNYQRDTLEFLYLLISTESTMSSESNDCELKSTSITELVFQIILKS